MLVGTLFKIEEPLRESVRTMYIGVVGYARSPFAIVRAIGDGGGDDGGGLDRGHGLPRRRVPDLAAIRARARTVVVRALALAVMGSV